MSDNFWAIVPPQPKPGPVIPLDGSYSTKRTMGDHPFTCAECNTYAWTLHQPLQYGGYMVCANCFDHVKACGSKYD